MQTNLTHTNIEACKQASALHLCQSTLDALCQQYRNTHGPNLKVSELLMFGYRKICVSDLLKGSKDLKAPVKMVDFQAITGVVTRGLRSSYQTYRKALHLNINMRMAA